MMCGESYKLHYQQKIRTTVHTGALAFGSALDTALNELLLPTGKDAYTIFTNEFTYGFINNEKVYLPTHSNMVYANTDYDGELLTTEDKNVIKDFCENKKLDFIDNDVDNIYATLKLKKTTSGFDSLSLVEKEVYNYINWLSLKRKGNLMLDAYQKKVIPKLDSVLAVQEKIQLINDSGDEVTGIVDLVATVNGEVIILDNKTSASEYEADSVITSPQLSLYVHALKNKYKTNKAGYIVLRKQIKKNRIKICSSCLNDGSSSRAKTCDAIINNKRCGAEWNETISPEVMIQFIVDEIPKKLEEMVVDNYELVNHAIKNNVFTKNFNSCNNTYGGKCPFYNLCHKGSMQGLVDLKKDKTE